MYISPINIDPADPSLPVVAPESYGKKLVDKVGQFYTQGFPEDTKALSEGILSEDEYLALADQIFTERKDLLDYELRRFAKLETGMHFFYFSSLDQNTHMYWRMMDESSPLYTPELAAQYGETILEYYIKVDQVVEKILSTIDINDPRTTFMIMSDHGFGAFNRQVNLNTWLYENGYLALDYKPGRHGSNDGYFKGVNWPRTGVYNVGINCLYINRQDREKNGTVTSGQAKGLIERVTKDLKSLKDPQTGDNAVSRVRIVTDKEHQRHPHAPDLIVGWNNGYRNSWKSILGGFESEVFTDNMDKWSGDHCIDPFFVPATLISNKKPVKQAPCLSDIGPTILNEFGIQQTASMTGTPLFRTKV
jgi:predicted AlkP superfamily phosphohydrolase/phosphomutase